MRSAPSLLLCILLCQCAGNATERTPPLVGDCVEAFYEGHGTILGLRNATSLPAAEVYSSGNRPNLKIARDEDMARLIAAFREAGFFASANGQPAPQAVATLTVIIDGDRSVLGLLPLSAAAVDNNRLFNDCLQNYRYVYDNTGSFHAGTNVNPRELSEQNERVRREARQALERHQGRK